MESDRLESEQLGMGTGSLPKIAWYRSPIDKGLMRELTTRSDARGFLQAGSFLFAFLVTTVAATWLFYLKLWIPMVVVCYLHSILLNFMYSAVHELSHGTVFRTKAFNEIFYFLFGFLAWKDPVHFRASHGNHHQVTVFRGVDKEVVQSPVRNHMNWTNYLTWFTFDWKQVLFWIPKIFLHAIGRPDVDYFFWDPLLDKADPRRGRIVAWARVQLILHLLLLALFIYLQAWILIYLVTFGVFFASGWFNLCGGMQHNGLTESTADWRRICHSFKAGPVTAWLYWNMQYHIEHHMYAAVPCYNLPKLSRAIAADLPPPFPSLSAGLRFLLQVKKRQGEEPGYVFAPDLPGQATEA